VGDSASVLALKWDAESTCDDLDIPTVRSAGLAATLSEPMPVSHSHTSERHL
jgi:hypothetical protein